MSRDGSCTSPGVVPHCLSQGQSTGPGLGQDQWMLLEGRWCVVPSQAKQQVAVTPSPPQGVTVGAARVSPHDWEHRLVVLTAS